MTSYYSALDGNGRRSHFRYPVDLGIRYRVARTDNMVPAPICDIGSGGVRFTSSEILPVATRIEFAIDWPSVQGNCRLQLKGWGRVLRSNEHSTVIRFERHEFRTRGVEVATLTIAGTP